MWSLDLLRYDALDRGCGAIVDRFEMSQRLRVVGLLIHDCDSDFGSRYMVDT